MFHLLWLIPVLPLLGFAANGLLGKRYFSKGVVTAVACGTVLASFLLSVGAFVALEWSGQVAREQAGAELASWYKPRIH